MRIKIRDKIRDKMVAAIWYYFETFLEKMHLLLWAFWVLICF